MRFVRPKALLAPGVGPLVRAGAASTCLRVLHHQVLFLKSILAVATDLVGTAFSGNALAVAAKFRKLIAHESIVAMVAGHVKIIRAMNRRGSVSDREFEPEVADRENVGAQSGGTRAVSVTNKKNKKRAA